jgi:hypothetical protein
MDDYPIAQARNQAERRILSGHRLVRTGVMRDQYPSHVRTTALQISKNGGITWSEKWMPPLNRDGLWPSPFYGPRGSPPGERIDTIQTLTCREWTGFRLALINLRTTGEEKRRIQAAKTYLLNGMSCLPQSASESIVFDSDAPSEGS